MSSSIIAQINKPIIDEFIIIDDLNDLYPPKSTTPSLDENISFNWTATYHTAFSNAVLIEQRINNAINGWYDKQGDLIKKHLESKYNKTYGSFDEAKNDVFLKSERQDIYPNSISPRNKYNNLYTDGNNKIRYNVGNIKALQLRNAEIASGNINNSQLSFMYVDGTSLKDIKDLTILNQYLVPQTDGLKGNVINTHRYKFTYEKLRNISTDQNFEQFLLNIKNNPLCI